MTTLTWLGVGLCFQSSFEVTGASIGVCVSGNLIRATTVGLITLVILGMATEVVPTLHGVDTRKLRSLWLPFVLVNSRCFMRVLVRIETDFADWAHPIAGVSGLLEVAGIGIWGVHLWRIMAGRRPAEEENQRPSRITADDKVGWIVHWYPETLPVLIDLQRASRRSRIPSCDARWRGRCRYAGLRNSKGSMRMLCFRNLNWWRGLGRWLLTVVATTAVTRPERSRS